MSQSDWKDSAELIGIVAIVASLIFVGFQLQQDRKIATAEIWSERNLIRAEMLGRIQENPDIWVKGLSGAELSESESVIFDAIASMYVHKESTHHGHRFIGISPGSPEQIAQRLVDMVAKYPGLRAFWEKHLRYMRANEEQNPFLNDVERLLAEVDAGRLLPANLEWAIPP